MKYKSNGYYLIQWKDDNEITVTDGWNLNAIKHEPPTTKVAGFRRNLKQ